ncbi:hypothetical protein C5167_016364 [Papaver somniferum]|nr:hypothetical protein C5167_016364 [Papaver somniferum]
MQKQRWDAAMQVEKIRASKTRKNISKAKKSVVQRTTTNGLFLDTNYPCLSIYGEMDRDLDYAIKHLARNGVLIDFHDMKPIEERLIVTDLGKKNTLLLPRKAGKWETEFILVCTMGLNGSKNIRYYSDHSH